MSFNNKLQVYATENKSNLEKEENLMSSVEEETVKDIEEKPILARELDLGDYQSEMFVGDISENFTLTVSEKVEETKTKVLVIDIEI